MPARGEQLVVTGPRRRIGLRERLLSPRYPSRVVVGAFALGVMVSTVLLLLPHSSATGRSVGFKDALFYAVSSVCVTGFSLGDITQEFSLFGQAVLLVSVQLGGFGITALASLLALLVSRRLGLTTRLFAQAETGTLGLGDVRSVLMGVALVNVVVESFLAVVLGLRFWLGYGDSLPHAMFSGLFHAVCSFNNAGLTLFGDSLAGFAGDPWICVPAFGGVFLGALGFPVIFELWREIGRPRTWSVQTRLNVGGSLALVFVGAVYVAMHEWTNARTLGAFSSGEKVLNSLYMSIGPRSSGFSTFDYAQATPSTRLGTDILMFIGGGPASTAGGIKITTFLLLAYAIRAEARGDQDINIGIRRVPWQSVRQAISVALLGVAIVVVGTMLMLEWTTLDLDVALFEVTSAFGTTGLSTGALANGPEPAQYLITALMFAGRLGTVTLASALALRERRRLFRLPEERPIIG